MGITNSNLRVPAVAGATYVGCFNDLSGKLNGSRLLADAYVSSYDMSVERCAAAMSSYKYFGLEYANECFGANSLSPLAEPATAAMCDFECVGATAEPCGAGYYINVFQNNVPAALPQCSLVVTSYIHQTTITQPASTVTSAAMTVTVTSSLTSTAASAATATTTPTTPPTDFYLYANATNQYITTGLGFSTAPNGPFRLNGSTLLLSSSLTPLGSGPNYVEFAAAEVSTPSASGDTFTPLVCTRDSLTGSIACSIYTYSQLASCVTIGVTALDQDGIGTHTSFAMVNSVQPFVSDCSYLDLVAVPVASYQPHTRDPAAPRYYIQATDPVGGAYRYVASTGQLAAGPPTQAFSFSGRVMFPANSDVPMYGEASRIGSSSAIGSGAGFDLPMACTDNGGLLGCDAGYGLNQMAVCNGSLAVVSAGYYADVPKYTSGCQAARFTLVSAP